MFWRREKSCVIQTQNGLVDILEPGALNVFDIARVLHKMQRWGAHGQRPWSVLEHSVLVSQLSPPGFEFEGAWHDAHEFFVGDVLTPIKKHVKGWERFENKVASGMRRAVGLKASLSPEVKQADKKAMEYERQALFQNEDFAFALLSTPEPVSEWLRIVEAGINPDTCKCRAVQGTYDFLPPPGGCPRHEAGIPAPTGPRGVSLR